MAMPYPSEAPDVPVFRLDDVHRLQADLLQHAERVLGPRSHDCTIAPACFVAGDTASATRIGREITIQLEMKAAGSWNACAALLGHEVVHALDGIAGPASWLEEGVACLFGIGQCGAMFREVPTYLCDGAYLHAVRLAASVPNVFDVVKGMRAQGIRMCKVTPAQMMAAAPSVDAQAAQALCARFQSEPIGVARVRDLADNQVWHPGRSM